MILSGLISKGCQSFESPMCLVTGLTKVDDITIMQLCNSLQGRFQDFFASSHGDLVSDQVQEVIFQIFIYEYSLVWDFIQRSSYVGCLRQSGSNVLIESRINIHGYVFQYELILARSAIVLADPRGPPRGEVARTTPTKRDLNAVFPVSTS